MLGRGELVGYSAGYLPGMVLPRLVHADEFAEDLDEIRDALEPAKRVPLPEVLSVGPGSNGPRVHLRWSGRLYTLMQTRADDGDDGVLVYIGVNPTERLLMDDYRLVGDPADLPLSSSAVVHTICWRVWERTWAAQGLLLEQHTDELSQQLNTAIRNGLADVEQVSE